jgi:cell division protein FtsB
MTQTSPNADNLEARIRDQRRVCEETRVAFIAKSAARKTIMRDTRRTEKAAREKLAASRAALIALEAELRDHQDTLAPAGD